MLKIIGAGLFRTSTASMKEALEILGYKSCYHFKELQINPGHIPLWLSVAEGGIVDWDRLFEGYQATVDSPACHYYRELMAQYPNAKVILTVRDPETWYQSSYETVYSLNRPTFWRKLFFTFKGFNNPEYKNRLSAWNISERVIWRGMFQSRFEDKAFAIKLFEQHIAEVKRNVPSDKLLVFNVKDGWEPLCHFLAKPIPLQEFPHVNDRTAFLERRKQFSSGFLAEIFKKKPSL